MKAVVRDQNKAYFFCFGASGEPIVRRLVRVCPISVDPFYELVLQDDKAGTWSVWYLDEVVPVNCPAQELVAKLLLWKRQEADFKRWRKEKHIGSAKPPLKKCFGGIRRKIRNWMKEV